jgi:chemotaxis protein MotB
MSSARSSGSGDPRATLARSRNERADVGGSSLKHENVHRNEHCSRSATMNTTHRLVLASVIGLVGIGCVGKGKYDQAVAQTQTTRSELAQKKEALARSNVELSHRDSEIATLKAEIEGRRAEITDLQSLLEKTKSTASADRQLDASRLAQLERRLAQLQAAQSASQARAALYEDLTRRLKAQLDAGDLEIVLRDGRMVLLLPDDVLFDSGRTDLKPAGQEALAAIAEVLQSLPQRQFQVAGHTDNVPIHTERFGSNWELSSGRALRVLHFLIGKGVDPKTLSAAGYGEVAPLESNDDADGRKRNRRTEITLQPNIDEIVRVP